MRPRLLGVVVAIAWCTAPCQADQRIVVDMTPAMIGEAIAAGERGNVSQGDMFASAGWGVVATRAIATFSTPFMRVAAAAALAKREYRPFTPADVTPDMIRPELHIYAWAQGELPRVSNVRTVVLVPRKGKEDAKRRAAIHPDVFEDIPTVLRNAFGASADANGKMAVFPLHLLSDAYELRVVYDASITVAETRSDAYGCTECSARFRLRDVR